MQPISDDVVASRPGPGMGQPSQVCFSPCRQFLTFLQPFDAADLLSRQLSVVKLSDVGGSSSNAPKSGVFPRLWDPTQLENENNLSLDEKLRRERSRQMSIGVTQYAWPGISNRMLIPLGGDVFCKEVDDSFLDPAKVRQVFAKSAQPAQHDNATGGALDATLSPDGNILAFVRDSELYVKSVASGSNDSEPATRLTFDARGKGLTNGLADYLAQEEMDRYKGFWFSQDSQWIAFEQVDEAHIPEYRIMHQGSDKVGDGAQEDHRYPFAGKKNPLVKMGVVRADASRHGDRSVQWLDLNGLEFGNGETIDPLDYYLGRVDWLTDGSLALQVMNREQTELLLVRYAGMQAGNVTRTVLLKESSKVWINLHDLFVTFNSKIGEELFGIASGKGGYNDSSAGNGFFFLWGSERSGFMHVYLYYFSAAQGQVRLLRELTWGDWMVNALVQVNVNMGLLFFVATKDGALDRNVYACKLWSSAPGALNSIVRVTDMDGTNALVIDSECSYAVLSHSSLSAPPSTVLCSLEIEESMDPSQLRPIRLKKVCDIHSAQSPLVAEELEHLKHALTAPEMISFATLDAKAQLFGCVYKPDAQVHGPGPYPLIVAVYGGPHVQRVLNTWATTNDMRAQRFAQAGYVVLKVDNRGSSARGLAFEGAIKHCMGTVEVDDQVDGVSWLVARGLADPQRVGMYGWSYGGYMSLMCLFRKPEVFHVAVSGAPVTHWDGYDTCYTERYMGTPQSNPKGYVDGSAMAHVSNMSPSARLMLVHGLIDENVHFRHTARLINSIVAARKNYDLLLFPDERHAPRKQGDRVYMEQRIKSYFDTFLMNRK